MCIIRVEHHRNYTCISNDAIRDSRLSFKARGIHHLLLSYPNNWEAKVEHLAQQSEKDGRSAVLSGLDELEEFGYLNREQLRDAKGQFVGWQVIVKETPKAENPTAVKTDYGKSAPIINTEIQNKHVVKEIPIPPLPPQGAEGGVKVEELREQPEVVDSGNVVSSSVGERVLEPVKTITKITANSSTPPITESLERDALLQELAGLLQEPVDSLQTNTNLQSCLDRYPRNIPEAIEYLKQAVATWKNQPGIGAFIVAVREGRKPQATAPGGGWGEWVRKAERNLWFLYSQSQPGNDVIVYFRNGVSKLWSELRDLTWEAIEVIATGRSLEPE